MTPIARNTPLYKRHTPKRKTSVTALHALHDAKNHAPYALHEALQAPKQPSNTPERSPQ